MSVITETENTKNSWYQQFNPLNRITNVISAIASYLTSYTITIGDQDMVTGSGNLASERREYPPFESIICDGVVNVILTQNGNHRVTVEADDNLLDLITTDVFQNSLRISTRGSFTTNNPMLVYIETDKIAQITSKGVGNLTGEGHLHFSHLTLKHHSIGNVQLNLQGEKLNATSTGVGNLTLSGAVETQKIDHRAVGNYKASNLRSKHCKVISNGIGNVYINTSDTLDVRQSGIGNVYYKGNPAVTQSVDGIGKLVRG